MFREYTPDSVATCVTDLIVGTRITITPYSSTGFTTINTQDVLNVKAEVTITNAAGKVVYAARIINKQQRIDVSQLTPAVYFIELNVAGQKAMQRFLKV